MHNCNRFTFAQSISQVPSTILYSLNAPIFHVWMYLLLKQVQHKKTASPMSRCWNLNTVIHWSHTAFNIFYAPQKKRARSSFFLLEEGFVFIKDTLKVKATERMDMHDQSGCMRLKKKRIKHNANLKKWLVYFSTVLLRVYGRMENETWKWWSISVQTPQERDKQGKKSHVTTLSHDTEYCNAAVSVA